jgi:hypothetical protein
MDPNMFTELDASAKRLHELNNSIDHSINQKIKEVEERLAGVGVEAFLDEPLYETDGVRVWLGYGRDPRPWTWTSKSNVPSHQNYGRSIPPASSLPQGAYACDETRP